MTSDKTLENILDHSGFINCLTGLYARPAYLQIGGDIASTFHKVKAKIKHAATLNIPGNDIKRESAESVIFSTDSDSFFLKNHTERYDVILIDGHHTFEQTLKDLLNSLLQSHDNSIIILDNIIPSSYAASLPDIGEWSAFRQKLGISDESWMGDVYKCAKFIEIFLPSYSFATCSEHGNQLIMWKSPRKVDKDVESKMASIVSMQYKDIINNSDFMNFKSFAEIFEIIKMTQSQPISSSLQGDKLFTVDFEGWRSCNFQGIYDGGGFYDIHLDNNKRSNLEKDNENLVSSAKLYDSVRYEKPINELEKLGVSDTKLQNHYKEIQNRFHTLPSVEFTTLRNAIVWKNVVFLLDKNVVRPLYETSRECDRHEQPSDFAKQLEHQIDQKGFTPGKDGALFIGSAGSFNYGHWLIDDLPRLSASLGSAAVANVNTIVTTSFQSGVDDIRTSGFKLCGEIHGKTIGVQLLDPNVAYLFRELNYVTPVTYHPVLKHPAALQELRSALVTYQKKQFSSVDFGERIFINRKSTGLRKISNIDTVLPMLKLAGFREIFTEDYSFLEQISMFSRAKAIVGVMGAAMCNVMFSQNETEILYLAPEGWSEPFYWDLATVLGQNYKVSFGPPIETTSPSHLRDFQVDVHDLKEFIDNIM